MIWIFLIIALIILVKKDVIKLNFFNMELFKDIIGVSESSGNYDISYPAYGKYQFIISRLTELQNKYPDNLPIIDENNIHIFLSNPNLQDKFFEYHVKDIKEFIRYHNLNEYEGQTITGKNKFPQSVKINQYGLIAGAHLGGSKGLYNFLVKGSDKKDMFGTYISDYVAKFSYLTA